MRSLRALLLVAVLVVVMSAGVPLASAAEGPAPEPRDVDITIDTVPTGRRVTVDFTPYTAPVTFTCVSGTTRNLFVSSPQIENNTRFVFRAWSDGYPNDGRNRTIDCDTATNLTALFDTEHRIALTSIPTGRTVVLNGTPFTTPMATWCGTGSIVLVVVPSPQIEFATTHTFTNWSDGGAASRTIVCSAPADLQAFFLTEFSMTIFTVPAGLPVRVDGGEAASPVPFQCASGDEHVVAVPARLETEDASLVFDRWQDGVFDPVRVVRCDRPANLTAFFIGTPGPGTPGPPPSLPVVGILLAVSAIAAGVALAIVGRRSGGALPPPPVRSCPSCRTQAAADWVYCSSCGVDLRLSSPRNA